MLIHCTKIQNLVSIQNEGIRPFDRPIHMISQRYRELMKTMGGEVTGRLARVECFLHLDVEELQAWWERKGLAGHWFTPGNGTYLCDRVIEWDFVSHVEIRDPPLTAYSRRVARRDDDVGLRRCTFCGVGSAPGWQICLNRATSGICYTPLTQAGANDLLTAAKGTEDFDRLRVAFVKDEPSRRAPQSGGRDPKEKGQNYHAKKRAARARKEGFVSHYARYEFDAKYRQDCIDNNVGQELYLREYDPKRKIESFKPAEDFVITDEVRQNRGRIIGGTARSAVRKDDEEPASTWEPTSRGRAALFAKSSQPFDLRENPDAMTGGSSSYREKSERRRRSSSTRRHKTGKEPPYKRYR